MGIAVKLDGSGVWWMDSGVEHSAMRFADFINFFHKGNPLTIVLISYLGPQDIETFFKQSEDFKGLLEYKDLTLDTKYHNLSKELEPFITPIVTSLQLNIDSDSSSDVLEVIDRLPHFPRMRLCIVRIRAPSCNQNFIDQLHYKGYGASLRKFFDDHKRKKKDSLLCVKFFVNGMELHNPEQVNLFSLKSLVFLLICSFSSTSCRELTL
eukprot:TRINITY_DN8008_c0_g1_i1.p1 TRINITY_DN8008_c0_g1~~TRINITY_DN8008_c0_g1_i1.p1  ORF type:complete len:209 (+),score=45.71 TRINITY_DN8008_c0_g1_i1:26-652(+)